MKRERLNHVIDFFGIALILTLSSFLAGNFYIFGPLILGYLYFFEINEKYIKLSKFWALMFLISGQIMLVALAATLKPIDKYIVFIIIHCITFMLLALLAEYKRMPKRG